MNPNAARRIRRIHGADPLRFDLTIRSLTGDGPRYRILVDRASGEVACDCPDFVHRRARVGGVCKHIARALRYVSRAGVA